MPMSTQPQHLKVPMFYRFSNEHMKKSKIMHFLHDDDDGLWPDGSK